MFRNAYFPIFSAIYLFNYFQSLPLSTDMNEICRYYIDWAVQLLACIAYYALLTIIIMFFIGIYLYIIEMVEDLRASLINLTGNVDTITNGLVVEIQFHNDVLE